MKFKGKSKELKKNIEEILKKFYDETGVLVSEIHIGILTEPEEDNDSLAGDPVVYSMKTQFI